MCMIWHDVTKEPLPKGHDVLAQVAYTDDNTCKTFVVLYYVDCGDYSHYSSEFDHDSLPIKPNGEFPDKYLSVTHWSYIDPSGLPD